MLTTLIRTFVLFVVLSAAVAGAEEWRHFRGTASNSSSEIPAPISFKVLGEKENVAWTADLPGRGPASPIVVGGRVIVTASSGGRDDRLHVLAFDAKSGKQLWHRQFWATGRTISHPQSANAAPSPASDGQRIFAFYSSNDLICLDLDGNLLWYRGLTHDYPKAANDVGMSSSPVVAGDTVIVQVENQADSFAAGIDVATGENRWKIARAADPTWTSPVAVPSGPNEPHRVLLQSSGGLTLVDARTGNELWTYKAECEGIPSPVVENGAAYVPSGGMTKLKLAGTSQPEAEWTNNKLGPGAASPVLHGGRLYTINRGGVLSCADPKDGEQLWQVRAQGSFWATPVFAGKHAYLASSEGKMQIIELGDKEGKLVGSVDFGEAHQATPALADGAIYVRTDKHLWKIAK